jgi:hypothetical protein
MGRKRLTPYRAITLRAPAELAGPLGNFADPELRRGLRVVAYHLRQAAQEIGQLFSDEEWRLLARALEDRIEQLELSPDAPDPGRTLAAFVEQGLARLAVAGPEGAAGDAPLAQRVAGLTHLQSWALVIALDFEFRHREKLAEGARWWEVATRWAVLSAGQQEET